MTDSGLLYLEIFFLCIFPLILNYLQGVFFFTKLGDLFPKRTGKCGFRQFIYFFILPLLPFPWKKEGLFSSNVTSINPRDVLGLSWLGPPACMGGQENRVT